MICVKNVRCGYGKRTVLNDVSACFEDGRLTVVVGPNGCGKTTLLRAVGGDIRPAEGKIEIDGIDAAKMSRREKARRVARFHQERMIPDMTVRRLVEAGRYPLMPFVGRSTDDDARAVENAMRVCRVDVFSERFLKELSGGERQRVYIAMLLAQETKNILLDEPAAFLDPAARFDMLDMLKGLAEKGYAVGVVMHDIALAMQYADNIIVMKEGNIEFRGKVSGEVNGKEYRSTENHGCAADSVEKVFGIELEKTASGAYVVARKNGGI